MRKTPTVAGIRMGLSPTALILSHLKPRLPHLVPSSQIGLSNFDQTGEPY
jgi:hypothetical protein